MRTIWKHPLTLGEQLVPMRFGSALLHVGEQNGQLTVWFHVPDDKAAPVPRRIVVVGTGHDCSLVPIQQHVGTVQMRSGLVWHVFDGGEVL